MKIARTVVPALLAVVGFGAFAAVAARREPNRSGGSPVIVELFTSEGCSSCPPADAVLASLAKKGMVGAPPVIVLSEHVDYWNRQGWLDPFSSAEFSARQNEYAYAFRIDAVYTPQMVVDGRAEFVGSDAARAHASLADAARRPKARVALTAVRGSAGVSLHVTVDHLPKDAESGAYVFVALTEDGLSSQVTRGENAGHRLPHVAVVRHLVRVGTVGSNGTFTADKTLPVAADWHYARLRAVAFVQEEASFHIVGAAQTSLAAP